MRGDWVEAIPIIHTGSIPVLATNEKYMKWIIKQFGNVRCLFLHDFILDKHKMHKAYGPQECQICGRWWKL
jgi:hypothetical protein